MDGSRPAPTGGLFQRNTDEVQIVLVEELGTAIWTRRPGQRRNRVDDELETASPAGESLLGTLPLVDIGQEHAPVNDVAGGIAKRKSVVLKPAIDAIRPPEALQDLVWGAGRDGLREDVDDARKIVRMDGVVRAPFPELLQRPTGVFDNLAIDELHFANRAQQCDQPWNAVHDQARSGLEVPHCRIGLFLFPHGPRAPKGSRRQRIRRA